LVMTKSRAPTSSLTLSSSDTDAISTPNKNNDVHVPSQDTVASNEADDDDFFTDEHEDEIEQGEEALAEEEEVSVEEEPSSSSSGKNDLNLGSPQWFELKTGNRRIDKAYKLAMKEVDDNIVATTPAGKSTDAYFTAGNGWTQSWTRDTSYAIELSLGLIRPEVSLTSLLNLIETIPIEEASTIRNRTVWSQDVCGHFGGWPNLSDAIVAARGAWYLYVYTGNTTFLEWAFETTVHSLKRAERDVKRRGLFRGCSSFMESNSGYPSKYRSNGELVGKTKALSTNMLYWNGYHLASRMGEILMEDSDVVRRLSNEADKLKEKIRERFWQNDKGYYAYVEDEQNELLQQMEGLGEALVLLSEEFEESEHRIRSILDHTHRTDIGIPCLWPRFKHGKDLDSTNIHNDDHISERYHNGRIWPFVSGYFAIAAAQKGRADIFAQEMVRLIDLSEQQNTFAEFYELDKTFPEQRRRQLWSDAGYLGMVYQGLFGMVFEANGIVFAPSKPSLKTYGFKEMNERISLLNVKYRRAVLDVHVSGYGNQIKSFSVNGKKQDISKLDATLKGKQVIEIEVSEG
jgi:glycogen debranching enzyme